jgi:putative polyhydroxyalkanoate system protein
MATIEIHRTHALPVETLKKKVDEMSGTLDAQYAVKGHWQGEEMVLEGSGMSRGVKGRIKIDATTVLIEIDLPLLLRAMKGSIEQSITRKLDKVLANPSS